jgi:hypothetical protein
LSDTGSDVLPFTLLALLALTMGVVLVTTARPVRSGRHLRA